MDKIYIPTFEAFSNKDYDEAYNELQESNEPMVYDFAFSQDYEMISTYLTQIDDNTLTKASLNVEQAILNNIRKFIDGEWTADTGSHGRNDEMYASVYVKDDETTISKTQYLIDVATNAEYIEEDNTCAIIQVIKPIREYFVSEKDIKDIVESSGIDRNIIETIVDSFACDVTISNPTDSIIELFE